jgi:hypothetical protein
METSQGTARGEPASGEARISASAATGGRGLAAILFAGILGGAALLGFVAYQQEVEAGRQNLQLQLLAVGRLKAREIARWLEERRDDAAAAANGPMFAGELERWAQRGTIAAERREWLRGRLDRFRRLDVYVEVSFVLPDGRVLVSASEAGAEAHPVAADTVRRAIATGRVDLGPIHPRGDGPAARMHLDVVAPLTLVDARGSRPIGALVFGIDPGHFLYPLIQSWPTDSPSAESLLVQGDGEDVVFVNTLRHVRNAPMTMRRPLREPDLVAAKAIRGERGVVEGVDYRGLPVLGFIEAVEGSPWLLVSKVDQSEAYAPLRDYLWIYLAFVAGAAVLGGVAASARLRGVQQEALRREHDATVRTVEALEAAETEREALITRLQKALEDVKTLRGIVPICASCKRVRDDEGYWKQVESYVSEHTEAQFSHGVCPECARRLYPEYALTPVPANGESEKDPVKR